MPSRSKEIVVSVLSLALGAAMWAIVVHVTGKREAWDAALYWRVGLPVCYVVSGIFGFVAPRRAWRWGLLPFLGQFVWMLASDSVGSLMPLGAVVMGALSLPGVILAMAAAALAGRQH